MKFKVVPSSASRHKDYEADWYVQTQDDVHRREFEVNVLPLWNKDYTRVRDFSIISTIFCWLIFGDPPKLLHKESSGK